MPSDPQSTSKIASPAVGLTAPETSALIGAQEREIIRLRRQMAWFQRQIFGQKSERQTPEPEGVQGTLGEVFDVVPDVEPAQADQALHAIAALYKVEQQIREDALMGQAKLTRRQTQSKPVLERFFAWIDEQFDKQGFLPSSPFLGALAYIRERRVGLSVYLDDPEVSIDTNHLERALRVIPMGKKNWLFSWTELGAKQVGIVQSLLVTCRMHDINPYDYFVDVFQRVGQHPASLVHQLTPRIWKEMIAANPLRSDLHDLGSRRAHAIL